MVKHFWIYRLIEQILIEQLSNTLCTSKWLVFDELGFSQNVLATVKWKLITCFTQQTVCLQLNKNCLWVKLYPQTVLCNFLDFHTLDCSGAWKEVPMRENLFKHGWSVYSTDECRLPEQQKELCKPPFLSSVCGAMTNDRRGNWPSQN